MLAGDVLVSLVGGNLLIEGDAEANSIAITSGQQPGTLVIQGLDGTEITFGAAAPAAEVTVEGVHGNVRVGLGEGDDTVAIHDARFRRNVMIATGAGEDEVRIAAAADAADALDEAVDANVTVRGSLTVLTGEDGDDVTVGSAAVGGLLTIVTDGGEDAVSLGAEEAAALADDGEATLHARLGISVLLGEGADTATLRDLSARAGITVGGGDGADTIGVHDAKALVLGVRGGGDEAVDNVALSGLKVGHAVIELGAGADELAIVDSVFQSLAAALGAGDDSLSISTVTARRALLAGGEGDADELSDAGDNTIRRLTITGFELPPDANTDPVLPRTGRPGPFRGPLAGLLGRRRQ
jgi:hypothetical protein